MQHPKTTSIEEVMTSLPPVSASSYHFSLTDRATIFLSKPLFYTLYVIAVPAIQLAHLIITFIFLLYAQIRI
jgi:hypothetical protein